MDELHKLVNELRPSFFETAPFYVGLIVALVGAAAYLK